ncbi:DNA-binding response regulator [Dactylosporangium sp. NPDC005555]|uniref:DNA-binding response regulator n=1 Tax=Dactylosporangium sp. NPDC005555 TaxID=3154889 RepID=UPI0033BF17A3
MIVVANEDELSVAPVRVAVLDPLPLYRQGVEAALAPMGYAIETPADVLAWSRKPQTLVLLTLAADEDWGTLDALGGGRTTFGVIALLTEDSGVSGVRAIRAGARSVLPRGVTGSSLRRGVEATVEGNAVMPASVATALASGAEALTAISAVPTIDRFSWLADLAQGTTVAELADRVGYSERAMFRQLQALYRDMGVQTRTQAIVLAQERGWLRPSRRPR